MTCSFCGVEGHNIVTCQKEGVVEKRNTKSKHGGQKKESLVKKTIYCSVCKQARHNISKCTDPQAAIEKERRKTMPDKERKREDKERNQQQEWNQLHITHELKPLHTPTPISGQVKDEVAATCIMINSAMEIIL